MISERAKRAGLKELEIFDDFYIDRSLPKYFEPEVKSIADPTMPAGTSFNVSNQVFTNEGWSSIPVSGDNGVFPTMRVSWVVRLWRKFVLYFTKKKRYANIYDFFMDFQGKVQDLDFVEDMSVYYSNALKQAKESGQIALQDKIKDLADILKYETLLFAMRLTKFVTEEQIWDFYEMKAGSDKALKLTWIKNFVRIIPSNVLEIKKKVDEQKIFDNYVILHYDIKGTGSELSKKEKEIKKDPILFGLLKKSKKLYYIADWKDEVCDLTLATMFTELGENVLKINNKSVKSYMDTGSDERKRSFKRKKA